MIFALIILSIIVLTQIYVIYNLYQKYETMEQQYDDLSTKSDEDVSFILSIRNRVMSQRSYLKQLDRNGAFESDDEVGYFFKELKKIVNDISLYFDVEDQNETNQQQDNIRSVITERF
jgi:hypothetical protein